MKFFWTRIVSVFGKNDMDHTLIMYLIKTIMSGNRPILTKCEQIWDYMYVKDCANALIHIAEKGDPEKIYPIASGHSEMLRNYVETIRDMIDPDVELGFGEKDYYPHQPMFLSVDISQLKKDTGFEPAYSFKDGVKEVIDYIRAHSE